MPAPHHQFGLRAPTSRTREERRKVATTRANPNLARAGATTNTIPFRRNQHDINHVHHLHSRLPDRPHITHHLGRIRHPGRRTTTRVRQHRPESQATVVQPVIIDQDTGRILWRTADCAAHCGISDATWRSYVRNGMPPAPVAHLGKLSLWDAEEVRRWHSSRRGQGWRGSDSST